jgi:hypothetical protein
LSQGFLISVGLLAACSAGALLVYGGVWGAMRFLRMQWADIQFRLETVERQGCSGGEGIRRGPGSRRDAGRGRSHAEKAAGQGSTRGGLVPRRASRRCTCARSGRS